MKNLRTSIGPVRERPFFKSQEIEEICLSELKKTDLLPEEPQPIRIDRFIENRFKISPTYEDIGDGILGFTKFGTNGVEEIYVARSLDEEGTDTSNRRIRSTLAHEAGHGLLHAYIFALGAGNPSLFNNEQPTEPKILCREVVGTPSAVRRYDGRWWEYQANKAMAALLLPKPLVQKVVRSFLEARGLLGGEVLSDDKRQEAVRKVSEIFDVNPIVAKFRLEEMYPLTESKQLSL
ncbi:ImmA/IrrE family metallo-endopeptidase [Candidatus Gracilibacteria bacterium]|nr:ImmA/IrrE family metallo-endopeptidase [Candidatus Gracilibacteria bacterium]